MGPGIWHFNGSIVERFNAGLNTIATGQLGDFDGLLWTEWWVKIRLWYHSKNRYSILTIARRVKGTAKGRWESFVSELLERTYHRSCTGYLPLFIYRYYFRLVRKGPDPQCPRVLTRSRSTSQLCRLCKPIPILHAASTWPRGPRPPSPLTLD